MRIMLAPAALAAALALAPAAFAGQTATGSIKSIDMEAHTLTLSDGTVYMLPSSFRDPGLKVGEKVSVSWEMHNGKHLADTVTITK
jgi:Cu/Ag efflux protein CusF